MGGGTGLGMPMGVGRAGEGVLGVLSGGEAAGAESMGFEGACVGGAGGGVEILAGAGVAVAGEEGAGFERVGGLVVADGWCTARVVHAVDGFGVGTVREVISFGGVELADETVFEGTSLDSGGFAPSFRFSLPKIFLSRDPLFSSSDI